MENKRVTPRLLCVLLLTLLLIGCQKKEEHLTKVLYLEGGTPSKETLEQSAGEQRVNKEFGLNTKCDVLNLYQNIEKASQHIQIDEKDVAIPFTLEELGEDYRGQGVVIQSGDESTWVEGDEQVIKIDDSSLGLMTVITPSGKIFQARVQADEFAQDPRKAKIWGVSMLQDDAPITISGLTIGSTREEVYQAFGEPVAGDIYNNYSYEFAVNVKLIMTCNGETGKVSECGIVFAPQLKEK